MIYTVGTRMALSRAHTSNKAQQSLFALKYVNKPDFFHQDPCIIPGKLHDNAKNAQIIKMKGFGSVPLSASASKVAESVFCAKR